VVILSFKHSDFLCVFINDHSNSDCYFSYYLVYGNHIHRPVHHVIGNGYLLPVEFRFLVD